MNHKRSQSASLFHLKEKSLIIIRRREGKMQDPFHSALENMAKYDDIDCLKSLYRNYYNLRKLGQTGNQSAISIYLDLEKGLNSEELTYNQRYCIKNWLIKYDTIECLQKDSHLTDENIRYHTRTALQKINKILEKKEDDDDA